MRVNLSEYRLVPKNHVYRYWKMKIPVYAHVYHNNEWIRKGFYHLQKTPLIWRQGIMDLLTDEEVDFAVKKGDYEWAQSH